MKKDKLKRLPLKSKASTFDRKIGTLDWVLFVILGIYALLIIYPFYNALLISISPEEVYLNSAFLIWPKEVTFDNYLAVFDNALLWSGFRITMILLIAGTTYQLFFTVITGYALSRSKWTGKNFVMNMILVTMFFGGGLVPYFHLIKMLGLYDNILVMIIPGAIDTFNMLLMRNYFASLPKEMEESAKIDGANDIQIFVKVYLPMSLPMLATIGLFFAVGNWNSWYNGMLFIETARYKPLQLILRELIATSSSSIEVPGQLKTYGEGLTMATTLFTIVPMMCFYPFLQKYFVKGLVVGAIKGQEDFYA